MIDCSILQHVYTGNDLLIILSNISCSFLISLHSLCSETGQKILDCHGKTQIRFDRKSEQPSKGVWGMSIRLLTNLFILSASPKIMFMICLFKYIRFSSHFPTVICFSTARGTIILLHFQSAQNENQYNQRYDYFLTFSFHP